MNIYMHSSETFLAAFRKNVWLPPHSNKLYPPLEANLRQWVEGGHHSNGFLDMRIVGPNQLSSTKCNLHRRTCYFLLPKLFAK